MPQTSNRVSPYPAVALTIAGSDSGGDDVGMMDGSSGDIESGSGGSGSLDEMGDEGCGCVSGRTTPSPLMGLWMLGLLGLARRRR